MLLGGCCCGAIRYAVEGPTRDETNCHCTTCRRTSGAPYLAWFTVALRDFHWLRGVPRYYDSSAQGRRGFCAECGTQLTFADATTPDWLDVTTCSLDHPEGVPPRDHVWTRSRLPWLYLHDLPEYPRRRRDGFAPASSEP
ncbi:MAG TPA: GFA family protein [Nevskia sp.]|nr:GFA family protein [Nevskia sp.]